jgi:hypothetical protein
MIRKAFGQALLYFLVSLTACLVACHRQGATESRDANKGTDEVTVYVSTDRVFSDYITHDRAEAQVMACRVALMRNGRITQIVTPDELRERSSRLNDVHVQIEVPRAEVE